MRAHSFLVMCVAMASAQAQETPVGVRKTIDDRTGQDRSLVRISESAGELTGRIERLLHPSVPDPTCEKCTDERHGKPILGLAIIQGLRRDGEAWDGGRILDPENGKISTVRLRLLDGGRLEVRGYLGPFFLTQTWTRAQ
jgi:uncharacterized protein (DUF2147 family)